MGPTSHHRKTMTKYLVIPGADPATGGRLPVHLRRRVHAEPAAQDGDEHPARRGLRPRRAALLQIPQEIR